jgi:hypothetical protein
MFPCLDGTPARSAQLEKQNRARRNVWDRRLVVFFSPLLEITEKAFDLENLTMVAEEGKKGILSFRLGVGMDRW